MHTVRCSSRLMGGGGSACQGAYTPPRGQTDTCENITFPQLPLRTVIKRRCFRGWKLRQNWLLNLTWKPLSSDIYCVAGSETRHGSAVSAAVWDGENAGTIQGTGIPQRPAHGEYKTTGIPQRSAHSEYKTAGISQFSAHSEYKTTGIPQYSAHSEYKTTRLPQHY